MLISIFADTEHTHGVMPMRIKPKERVLNESTAKILAWQEEQSLGVCARVGR